MNPTVFLSPPFANALFLLAFSLYAMSLLLSLKPLLSRPNRNSLRPKRNNLFEPTNKPFIVKLKSQSRDSNPAPLVNNQRWDDALSNLASLYPLYVTVGGAIAFVKPSTFAWFVERAPTSYSCALACIMLAMGLTLELKDLIAIFKDKPFSILIGCISQYTIMPIFAAIISKSLGLSPSLSVGLILLGCCPGGTASNVVTLIAKGDVPLSIVMTVCSTLGAVIITPLLTKILAGAYVPVDALGLSISTLQVVVAPILLGSYIQSNFPSVVKVVIPFAPLFAVLASSILASSVFSENFVRLKSSFAISASASFDLKAVLLSVLLLHFAGFFVGYICATICGFKEKERRAISIEVGMQNSSLGVVLATSHFTSPFVALPAALSAIIMNLMGSSLGFIWRHIEPNDNNEKIKG